MKKFMLVSSILFLVSQLCAEPSQYVMDLGRTGPPTLVAEENGDALLAVTEDQPYYVSAGWRNGSLTVPTWGQLLLVKFDATGTTQGIQWQRVLPPNPAEGKGTRAEDIVQAQGGGYIVAGSTDDMDPQTVDGDYFLAKFDTQGSLLWAKAYGGPEWDRCQSVLPLKNESGDTVGYTLFGYSETPDNHHRDLLAIDVDLNGDTLTNGRHRLTGPQLTSEEDARLYETPDGFYMILGFTQSTGVNPDQQALGEKWTKSWQPIWAWTYGGKRAEGLVTFVPAGEGQYLLGGGIHPGIVGGTQDMLFVEVNSGTGATIGNPVVWGTQAWDFCKTLLLTSDANVAMVGGWVGRTATATDCDILMGRFNIGAMEFYDDSWRIGEAPSGNLNDLGRDLIPIPPPSSGYVQSGRSGTWGQGTEESDDLVLAKYLWNSGQQSWSCTGNRIPALTLMAPPAWTTAQFSPSVTSSYAIHQIDLQTSAVDPGLDPDQQCLQY